MSGSADPPTNRQAKSSSLAPRALRGFSAVPAPLGLIGKSAPISTVRRAPRTASCSLGLSPPKANKTVSFLVSFHRGAPQSGILFLVSIARATARRIYHCRPWLSDVSHLRGAPSPFLARPGCGARRCRRTEARNAALASRRYRRRSGVCTRQGQLVWTPACLPWFARTEPTCPGGHWWRAPAPNVPRKPRRHTERSGSGGIELTDP